MKTMTIRDVPEDLLAALKRTAKRCRRSVNQQVLIWLEEAWLGWGRTERDVEEELAEVRRLRGDAVPMSAEEIDAAGREGRA
jgi:hypothetical protein